MCRYSPYKAYSFLFTQHLYLLYTTLTVRSLFLSIYNLFATPTCSAYSCDVQTSNFIQHWLNYHWLLSALSCPFIVQQDQSNECFWSRRFLLSLSREFYFERLYMYILIHVFPSCLLLNWKVFGVFVCISYRVKS